MTGRHGLDPGDEQVHPEPVVEFRIVASRQGDRGLHQPRVGVRRQHREPDPVTALLLRALVPGQAGFVSWLTHDEHHAGPQRAAGDLAGMHGIEAAAAQDVQGDLGCPQRGVVLLFACHQQLGCARVRAQHLNQHLNQGFQQAPQLP